MKPLTIGHETLTDRQDASLGLYFKDVSKLPRIDINEEIALMDRIKKGDLSAQNKLVQANLRFVISIAKQYQNKGLSLVDLIQEGNYGLLQAIPTYDASKGFKFISYAVWWIRQAITKAISDQCRTVRVPMNQIALCSKINKATSIFEQEHGRKPALEELDIPVDKSAIAVNVNNRAVSLDSAFDDEDAGCLLDILPNENSTETDETSIVYSNSQELDSILNNLPNREQDILRMSFGLGMASMQNEEIASRFGIGSERVRQLKDNALKWLKNNYANELRELL